MILSELIAGALGPVLDLFPQIHARPASNEYGVKDSIWSKPKLFRGPLLHIPALTHVEVYPDHDITVDLGLQTLDTLDGKSVALNATAIVYINDPLLLREIAGDEWMEYIAQRLRGVLTGVVADLKFSKVPQDAGEFVEVYSEKIMDTYGCEIVAVVLEDCTEVIPVRLFS